MATTDTGFQIALEEARGSLAEGGWPIGAAIVKNGKVLGRGRNQRKQNGSPILHVRCSRLLPSPTVSSLARAGFLQVHNNRVKLRLSIPTETSSLQNGKDLRSTRPCPRAQCAQVLQSGSRWDGL